MADSNGDGKSDLAVGSISLSAVSILLGHGDGTFSAPVNYGLGSNQYSVAVGDFNGDGKSDPATADQASGNVSILLNSSSCVHGDANGDGQVTVTDVFYLINDLFAGGPAPLGSGDANGDGSVTVADIFYLINYLFAGGPAPR